jgi:hypothetical protein
LSRFRQARLKQGLTLFLLQGVVGFHQMQAGARGQAGMVFLDGQKEIPCQPTGIGSLFHQMEDRWTIQGLVEFIRLPGEEFAQNRAR